MENVCHPDARVKKDFQIFSMKKGLPKNGQPLFHVKNHMICVFSVFS